jgi:hypothetical protein
VFGRRKLLSQAKRSGKKGAKGSGRSVKLNSELPIDILSVTPSFVRQRLAGVHNIHCDADILTKQTQKLIGSQERKQGFGDSFVVIFQGFEN